MPARWYLTVRLALWFVALFVAILPAFFHALAVPSFNNSQLFRDALFVTVPAAALGLSTVLDYLCMGFRLISGTAMALAVLGIVFNTLVLLSGVIGFLILPKSEVPLSATSVWTFSVLIVLALMFSLLTEIFVSKDHHRCHMQPALT